MSDPNYAYPYPAQGYYQGPPVAAPPQHYHVSPPRMELGIIEGCLAALCCCCRIYECCSRICDCCSCIYSCCCCTCGDNY